jgi:lia operon protein LiaG
MRKSARNRIIIWSIVSVLLIGLLTVGIIGIRNYNAFNFKLFSFSNDEIDKMSTGNAEFDKNEVKSIDINWTSGTVEIKNGNTDKVEISENVSYDKNSDNAMRWSLDDGKLKIYDSKNAFGFHWFSFSMSPKKLTVTLPESISLDEFDISSASAEFTAECINADTLDIETASGTIKVDSFEGNKADINTASGTVDFTAVSAEDVDVETVSGECTVTGKIEKLNVSGVSSVLNLIVGKNNSEINAETVSGNVNIRTNCDQSGFTANYSSVSDDFSSDFAGTNKNGKFVYGSGKADYNISTVSGNIDIQPLAEDELTKWLYELS